jgi:hypothetical protein
LDAAFLNQIFESERIATDLYSIRRPSPQTVRLPQRDVALGITGTVMNPNAGRIPQRDTAPGIIGTIVNPNAGASNHRAHPPQRHGTRAQFGNNHHGAWPDVFNDWDDDDDESDEEYIEEVDDWENDGWRVLPGPPPPVIRQPPRTRNDHQRERRRDRERRRALQRHESNENSRVLRDLSQSIREMRNELSLRPVPSSSSHISGLQSPQMQYAALPRALNLSPNTVPIEDPTIRSTPSQSFQPLSSAVVGHAPQSFCHWNRNFPKVDNSSWKWIAYILTLVVVAILVVFRR